MPLEYAKIWRVAQAAHRAAGEVRDERRLTSRRRCSPIRTDALRRRQARADVGHRDGDQPGAARSSSRPAARSSRSRSRRSTAPPRATTGPRSTSSSTSQLRRSKASRRPRSGCTRAGATRARSMLRPGHLVRAVDRDLPRAHERRRLDDRVQGQRPRPLPSFRRYKGRLPKKIAVGMISHRDLQVESVDEVAADIRTALEYIDADHLVLSSDCGFGRQGVPAADRDLQGGGARAGREHRPQELGVPATPVRAADPRLQIDVPAAAPAEVGSSVDRSVRRVSRAAARASPRAARCPCGWPAASPPSGPERCSSRTRSARRGCADRIICRPAGIRQSWAMALPR